MKLAPAIFYAIEVGSARAIVRLLPLAIVVLGIIGTYNLKVYKGLPDADSMDSAQLARQVARHEGFHTFFMRPYAVSQVAAYRAKHGQSELFPIGFYSSAMPRTIPDTYNSPGYPLVLAALFRLSHINLDETSAASSGRHMFIGDKVIPPLNQIFVVLTAGLLFLFGYRAFDERVAWIAPIAFLFSDFVWKLSLMAAPTCLLMLLVTLLLFAAQEIYRIAEFRYEEDIQTLGPLWLFVPGLAILLGVICLCCLPLLVLIAPMAVYVGLMRKTSWLFPFIVAIIAGAVAAPWFYHWYRACGNPLGSNLTLGLLGQGSYAGNQVFLRTTIPAYDQLFSSAGTKEFSGYLYYFQHGWSLLGSHPMVLLFAASILHEFRRRRVQALRWLVVGCALAVIGVTSLAHNQPDPVSAWNVLAYFFPVMVLIGTAFLFVMIDRLETQLPLFHATIVVIILALTAAPMVILFTTPSYSYYNYPPYIPPYLSYVSRITPPGEWITTDIPWATAWYGDRPSLWLPDTIAEFDSLYDDVCPTSLMLFSPETLGKPFLNLTSGEDKEWLPVLLGTGIPDTFPLKGYTKLPPGGPEYTILTPVQIPTK